MKAKSIKILALQETKINLNAKEQRTHYTFFFSGDTTNLKQNGDINDYTHAGVAIVISNELLNYIQDINPINDRIMTITLGYVKPLTIICNYSYPATKNHDIDTKINHYELLLKTQKKHHNEGPTYTIGDVNAKVQIKPTNAETPIGPHTFDKNHAKPQVNKKTTQITGLLAPWTKHHVHLPVPQGPQSSRLRGGDTGT